jgi:hypothetical protein
MTYRRPAFFLALAVTIVAGFLLPVAIIGQSAAATPGAKGTTASKPWTPLPAPDGHPDLQGVWLDNSATPFERPKALEGRAVLQDEEVAELKKRAARLRQNGSDFAGADGLFLAVWSDVKVLKSRTATEGLDTVAGREFDNRTSLIVDPPDGRLPPRTPEGQQREQARVAAILNTTAAGAEHLPDVDRCITSGVPHLLGPIVNYFQIIQTHDYFVFLGEVIHDARVIPLDGRPHLPDNIRQWSGDSRGHWERNTLVVETTNFSHNSNFLGAVDHLHLIERFTRVSNDLINYEITLDDPTTWTRPWTAVIRLKHTDDKIYEVACHEGNYETMHGILAGARAEERAAEEAAKARK